MHLPTKAILFADDLVILNACKTITIGETVLQHLIDRLLTWTSDTGLEFSKDKTSAIHFCKLRNCNKNISLHLDSKPLLPQETITYLGIIFDRKLSWKPHINHLKKSCIPRINLIRKLAHTSYGADQISLLRLYRQLIRSKCDYGLVLYASAPVSTVSTLNVIHHSALRRFSNNSSRISTLWNRRTSIISPSVPNPPEILHSILTIT